MSGTPATAALRSRTSAADGRIIITGTGRTGTTYLVQLFSALGFHTGFSLQESIDRVDEISHAGLELPLVGDDAPYVIKSPWFADRLMEALEKREIELYAAIIPLRGLFEAAESRRRVYFEAQRRGLDPSLIHGALWHTDTPEEQEDELARQLYRAVFALIRFEVPIFFLDFPRLVRDPDYQFMKLQPLMRDHGVGKSEFLAAHRKVAVPGLIHEFKPEADGTPRMPRDIPRRLAAADKDLRRLIGEVEDRDRRLMAADAELRRLIGEVEERDRRLVAADKDLRRLIGEVEERDRRLVAADKDLRRLIGEVEERDRRLVEINELRVERDRFREQQKRFVEQYLELDAIKRSSSWRLTAPLRRIGREFPGLARPLRRGLGIVWRALTRRPRA